MAEPSQQRSKLNIAGRDIKGVRANRSWLQRLKYILPTSALSLLIIGMIWPFLNFNQGNFFEFDFGDVMDAGRDRLQVVNFKFSSTDGDKQPYNLTAIRVDQQSEQSYQLVEPKADLLMAEGNWALISANEGIYDEQNKEVDLSGNVEMFHDLGYELYMPTMKIKLETGQVSSTDPVEGQAVQGYFEAEGITLFNKGRQLKLLGKSKMIITQ
ncbi:MAG: LPS export ABC transporter periplasmic protein LptC [Alphaproteobacteria bacterium]